ncbi:hypothetical protein BVY01_04520 [bacterium I07]|nr:hypothetical protein BVY01_04520 [bacterium I07]
MIGKVISHFKILEKLGEGGMGVVYKAHDTKLDRIIALKFLPPELTRDPEAKERFIHEARAASALRHNNICTIHEVDETDEGKIFICMDHYEGKTLKEKIKERPLKLEEAIDIAIQISKGLAEAHEAGIIHRDIKPANIIITEKNEAKILDFGLAKLTGQTKLTKFGSTLGTAAYMSPEQLKGNPVDHRTDIWALGVMMYEMLTGQLPFKGDYEQAITYAILNEEPEPITALRTGIPVALEGILLKLMAKDPKQRYQHVDEVPVDLKVVDSGHGGNSFVYRPAVSRTRFQQPEMKRKRMSWKNILLLAITAVLIFIAGWFLKPRPGPTPKQVTRFNLSVMPGEEFDEYSIAISPDGTEIVYGVTSTFVNKLYQRKLDQFYSTPIEGTEGALGPFFSPDGRELCFWADSELKKMSLDGGPTQTVCEAVSYLGGTWGQDGSIVFAMENSVLMRVSASGGIPEFLVASDSNKVISTTYYVPELLPGGKAILYDTGQDIAILNLETGELETLLAEGRFPRYSPTGHILFGRMGSIWAVPFDLERLKITGKEVLVQDGIYEDLAFRFSTNGTLVYLPALGKGDKRNLVLVDRHGIETILTDIQRDYTFARFSPGGESVVFGADNNYNLWIHDVARNTQIPFAPIGDRNWCPNWTPDGNSITFTSYRSGVNNIYLKRADGIGEAKRLFVSEFNQFGESWSDDGTLFAFSAGWPPLSDIWVYTTRDSSATPFLNTQNEEHSPAISPDGHWIAYVSDKTGRSEIYMTPYPGPGREELVSTQGGVGPLWAPDGRELFYREGRRMMVVSMETNPSLKLGKPELMFVSNYLKNNMDWIPVYDIHRDGEHFLMVKSDEKPLSQINIVVNWFEELQAKFTAEQK